MAFFKSPSVEGPGVSKNEPEKRGVIKFFELFFRYYGKLMSAGLLKCLFDLGLITSGLGSIGSARIARNVSRARHVFGTEFSDAIKENWKQALIMGIINNILSALSIFSIIYFYNDVKDSINFCFMVISFIAFLVITFMRFYSSAVLLMFKVSIGQLYKNCFILAFAGAKRNFIIFISQVLMYALVLSPMLIDIYVGFGIAVCLGLLVIPPMSIFIVQYNIFPVMMKYLIEPFMKNHPGEGENTLRELGLIEEKVEPLMVDDVE